MNEEYTLVIDTYEYSGTFNRKLVYYLTGCYLPDTDIKLEELPKDTLEYLNNLFEDYITY
jgi:hypothetical protein